MYYKNTFKPYMVNAFYTWAMDLGFTPLLEVKPCVDNVIPNHLNKKENIILNIHPNATVNLILGKQHIEFEAKFNGKPQQITLKYSSITRCLIKEDNSYGIILEDDEVIHNPISKKSQFKIIKKDSTKN